MAHGQVPMSGPRCRCGKVSFHTRRQAKAAAKRSTDRGKRVYICDIAPEGGDTVYHVGDLARDIRSGRVSRDRVYSREDREVEARQLVGVRARRACETCGGMGYEFSHRRTRAVRDDHVWCPCNGTLSCRTCHEWVHRHPLDARALGLMVSRYTDEPTLVPVRLRNGWVLLHCDGRVTPLRDDQVTVEHGIPGLAA